MFKIFIVLVEVGVIFVNGAGGMSHVFEPTAGRRTRQTGRIAGLRMPSVRMDARAEIFQHRAAASGSRCCSSARCTLRW